MPRPTIHRPALRGLLLAAALLAVAPALADDIDLLPASATFVISTGFWEDPADAATDTTAATAQPATSPRRGYYKLVSIRQADRSHKVYLQQIAALTEGPQVISSVEIESLTQLHPYVTDIRSESSSGISTQPGLFATVFLKTNPQSAEVESWTVILDELGELKVERASN